MAKTWNGTTLQVLHGSWRPGIPSTHINEIALIPDALDLSAKASVVQQGGRLRQRVKAKLYVTSMTAYNGFLNSYLAGTSGTLADGDTLNGSYMIESMGEPEYINDVVVFFDIVFVEV
ncbi:MAG: hypothetical protein ACM3PE_07585 [Deltaproteobacteria bacterium]